MHRRERKTNGFILSFVFCFPHSQPCGSGIHCSGPMERLTEWEKKKKKRGEICQAIPLENLLKDLAIFFQKFTEPNLCSCVWVKINK